MLPAVAVHCPYCGERIELLVDAAAGAQRYVEDCPVCCRPITVDVDVDVDVDVGGDAGACRVRVATQDDA